MKFSDINLIPRELSTISSRTECDTAAEFCGNLCSLPIIPSPMVDVVGGSNLSILNNQKIFTFIHRFQSVEDQLRQFDSLSEPNLVGLSTGLGPNGFNRFLILYKLAGARNFLIDTANGASTHVVDMVKRINDTDENCKITIGNFVSAETINLVLEQCKINAVRLFIGSGNACATKYNTGVHREEVDCLLECKDLNVSIIADGGISGIDSFIKAIAIGADMVMAGSVFAACDDSPACKISGGYVRYRGSSYGDFKKEPKYVEGYEKTIPRTYTICIELINSFRQGLQSAMSYFNSRNLKEFKGKFYDKNIFDSSSTIVCNTMLVQPTQSYCYCS